MRLHRVLLAILSVAMCSSGWLACSSGDHPPFLVVTSDDDASRQEKDSGIVVVPSDPCDPPAEGCSCTDAGVGAQVYCGTVYRTTGIHVDCAKGYRTCREAGTWGQCEGPRIFMGVDQ